MKKPNFFIVGAPKCGTTSMYFYLKQHPDIFMPDQKEPHFFGYDLNYTSLSIKNKKEYLSLFSEAQDEIRIGEASSWYLYSKLAAYEINKFNSFAKIIIMLRNPVDMLYSLHNYFVYTGREDIVDFESALAAEKYRKQGYNIPKSLYSFPVECLFYREIVKYTQQVERYLNIFESKNIHFIIFDDLQNNPIKAYQKTLFFLGIDEYFYPDFEIFNPGKRRYIRNKTLRDLIRNPFSIWLVRSLMPHPGIKLLSKPINGWNHLINKYEPIPSMERSLRRRLQIEFAPEVENLSNLLNIDLSSWSRE